MSIVALLAGLIFPALREAKMSAVRTSCISNLRQIGVSFHLYGADYDDAYPFAIDRYTRDHPNGSFISHHAVEDYPDLISVLSPYTGSSQIFHCPADAVPYRASLDETPTGTYPSAFDYAGTSYDFWPGFYLLSSPFGGDQVRLRLCWDAMTWHCPIPTDDITFETRSRNMLFGDGHAKFGSGLDL